MDYCKFHPLVAANFECESCHLKTCKNCVNQEQHSVERRCFICEQQLKQIVTTSHLPPFWRRLQESFKYPNNSSSLTLIIGVAILTPILGYLPFSFILYLAVMGAFFKYGFSCLKNTAAGNLVAPDVQEAYEGGFGVAWRLIVIMFVMIAVIYASAQFIGPVFAEIMGILLVIALPAIFIGFGLTESILDAINPVNIFKLITAVGLPYGLLLAFMMIMMGSVEVINSLIGEHLSFISTILQSIVSNYYLIVIMHIMGYMIFQYQGELGFVASLDEDDEESRSDTEKLLANIQVHLKEGYYSKVNDLFKLAIKNKLDDRLFYKNYFDFLIATKDSENLALFAEQYFSFLENNNQRDRLTVSYKQILKINAKFQPLSAEIRFVLATACRQSGEPKLAIKLLNGLHKDSPEFAQLVPAYELLAECFDDVHTMQQQAEKCRQFIEKLKQRKPVVKKTNVQADITDYSVTEKTKATFSSIDQSLGNGDNHQQNSEYKPQDDNKSNDLPPLDFY